MKLEIRPMTETDWPEVERIYLLGIKTGHATFETSSPGWTSWDTSHLPHSRWVAIASGKVHGWAALSAVSDRCVYGGVAEVSVYVDPAAGGRGIGRALLQKLIASSEENGIWTLAAAMFRENAASINLHEKCGFRKIGYREKVGKMNDQWRDTLLYERRSKSLR